MDTNFKRVSVAAALVGIAMLPGGAAAQAQTGWGNFQLHGSWISPASLAQSENVIVNGVLLEDGLSFGVDNGFGIGAGLDFWFGSSRIFGLSLEGTYKGWDGWSADFDAFDFDEVDLDEDDIDFGQDVALWQYDAALQLRLAKPTANTRWLPWLTAGVGGVTIDPDNDVALFPQPLCVGSVTETCSFEGADVLLETGSQTELAFVWGLGMDFFMSPSVAVRLEAKDYWTDDSPFVRLSDGGSHDGGHNWQVNGGLAFYWGGRTVQEPGFVREEPIMPPPPPPPPPPAEARVTMCVIDPQGYQLRTIDAVRVIDQNRIYVERNGQRTPFETAYPAAAPIYVRNASWYVADQPLVVDLETDRNVAANQRNRLELVQFGSPAQIGPSDLVFVGTINGSPIYARRPDVASFIGRLQPRLSANPDLAMILKSDAQLAQSFGGVSTYYLAVEPNCVFHPVSVTHFVRRTRG